MSVTNLPIPTAPVWMYTGFSDTQWGRMSVSLPLDLGPYGLTGCRLLVDPEVTYPIASINGTALWTLPIPNQPALVGIVFFNQAFGVDTAVPGGARLTNAGQGVVGAR